MTLAGQPSNQVTMFHLLITLSVQRMLGNIEARSVLLFAFYRRLLFATVLLESKCMLFSRGLKQETPLSRHMEVFRGYLLWSDKGFHNYPSTAASRR